MSVVLKKADGDLFIDAETGRGQLIGGPSKVDQELASLYLSDYDADRQWGSLLDIRTFAGQPGGQAFKAVLYLRVQQANSLMVAKQARDATLDLDNEKIQQFSAVQVSVTDGGQSGTFIVVANVGTSVVAKTIGVGYEPVSLGQVTPPPFDLLAGV